MQVQPTRVLGYLNAKELTNHELNHISGGFDKLTAQTTQKITGIPVPNDIELDQVWD